MSDNKDIEYLRGFIAGWTRRGGSNFNTEVYHLNYDELLEWYSKLLVKAKEANK